MSDTTDDPMRDGTDEAHPAWWRGYNADKGEIAHAADTARAEARTAHARVALLETERDEARVKQCAAEAEVTRLRAMLDGRTTPPTEIEVTAHAAGGGSWLLTTMHGGRAWSRIREHAEVVVADVAYLAERGEFARCVPLLHGTACEWPKVEVLR